MSLVALALWAAFFFEAASANPDKEAAKKTFIEATDVDRALSSKPFEERSQREYGEIVRMYRRVVMQGPSAGECDDALIRMAVWGREAYARFKSRKLLEEAVWALGWLVKEYPYSPLRREGLVLAGDICSQDLKDNARAREYYETYIRENPRGKGTPQVARKNQALGSGGTASDPVPTTSPGEAEPARPVIERIRVRSLIDKTVVLVEIDREPLYRVGKAENGIFRLGLERASIGKRFRGLRVDVSDDRVGAVQVEDGPGDMKTLVFRLQAHVIVQTSVQRNPFTIVVEALPSTTGRTAPRNGGAQSEQARGTPGGHAPKVNEGDLNPDVRQGERAPDGPDTIPSSVSLKPDTPRGGGRTVQSLPGITKPTPSDRAPEPGSGPSPRPVDVQSLPRILGMRVGKIVLDPGHGGKDTGSIGAGGLLEKDITLALAKDLKQLLEKGNPDLSVTLTREDDTFVQLSRRSALARRAHADIFISLHVNSSGNPGTGGFESFYLGLTKDKSAQTAAAYENAFSDISLSELGDVVKKITLFEKVAESRDLAVKVQRRLSKLLPEMNPTARDRGVKRAPFVVLVGAEIPSILLELGFLSNGLDAAFISDPEKRGRIAKCIQEGVENYLAAFGVNHAPPISPAQK